MLIVGALIIPLFVDLELNPLCLIGSLAEVERMYEIAINGSDDEKISAATVLCGSSLLRGWNVQVWL